MKSRTRLAIERLEDRWCPAVTATAKAGTLTLSGSPTGTVQITQDSTTAGTFTVLDNGVAITGSPFTSVKNIKLNLGSANDTVAIDLGGKTLTGNVTANLGGGANTLTVVHGGVSGRLSVSAGDANDTVTLGSGTANDTLTLKEADIALDGGIDTLTVKSGVTISRYLDSYFVNNVTLQAGSSVRNVFILGGTGGNTITAAGDITGDLAVDAYFRSASTAGTTLTVSGDVDGGVYFDGSNQADSLTISGTVGKGVAAYTGGGNDTVSITGAVTRDIYLDTGSGDDGVTINTTVGRSVAAYTGGGNDTVSISGAVTRDLYLDTGAGDDTITINSSVGGKTNVSAGSGNDTLTLGATAALAKASVISMGAGNDAVTLTAGASITSLLINGGTGNDSFTGNATLSGLTLASIETLL